MQQADKKEHTHRETGVGAEMRILKGMYRDGTSGYFFFTPNFKVSFKCLEHPKDFQEVFLIWRVLLSFSGFFRVSPSLATHLIFVSSRKRGRWNADQTSEQNHYEK